MSCPDCFQGSVHDEKPKGEIIKLHGLDTYVANPASGNPPKGIIVIIPDAFGFDFINNRILADHYAAKGDFLVYLPDFMLGHSAPQYMLDSVREFLTPGFKLSKPYHLARGLYAFATFKYHNDFSKSHPTVLDFFTRLHSPSPTSPSKPLPIFAAGFCWGGKHAILLSQATPTTTTSPSSSDFSPLLTATFTGHPSSLSIPSEIENLAVPVSFAIPEKDNQVSVEQAEVIRGIVEGHGTGTGEVKVKGEVRVYEGCGHGFCVRADLKYKDGEIARQAGLAEDQAVAWFGRFVDRAGARGE